MTNAGSDNASHGVKPQLLAFVNSDSDMAALKAFAANHQWPDSGIQQGDIRTAATFLKSHSSPVFLVVELPSASEAPTLLDELANVCDPETKVISIGDINEYSFYCWLMDLGIFSYLLKPLTEQALENAYQKSLAPAATTKNEKQPGKIIAVMGTRGGVGTTTISLNLAGIIASQSKKQVTLVDIDPQEGSVALALDIEPSRGLRDALEKPDRIDSLFIERMMHKPLKNLSVMSAEESLQDPLHIHDHTADTLLRELRAKFDFIVLDIPRHQTHFSRQALKQADYIVLVTELTLLSLRDALRMGDMLRESLKMKPPLVVANRIGLAPKQELLPVDFEKGMNIKIACRVTFAPDIFMQISSDIVAVKHKANPVVKPLYQLAEQLVPEAKSVAVAGEKKSLGLFAKKLGIKVS